MDQGTPIGQGGHWIVTGANRGIGLELARRLAARGNPVIGTAREPGRADELRALDVRVEQLDVADPDSIAAFGARIGDDAVDVLINNAGIGGHGESLAALDFDAAERMFRVNALGPLRVTRALLGPLRRGGSRLVAHVTSRMGSIADNTSGGAYGYRASKAALNMLNRSLAHELGPEGFRCVVLHPGWVRTDMGGSQAPLAVGESAGGLLAVLDGLPAGANGEFLDHRGEPVPW